MRDRLRVGLLFGGCSVEHEVSVISARGVARAMAGTSLECVPLAVTGDGGWLSPAASRRFLDGEGARVEPAGGEDDRVRLTLEPGSKRIVGIGPREGAGASFDVDVIFPVVHGWGGEDGRLQGALELAGMPYVGPGVLGSALAMDKAAAKSLIEREGIPVVPWLLVRREDHRLSPERVHRQVEEELGYPVFVKPANGGSSVGVSRVDREASLEPGLRAAFACDRRVVVERAVPGAREIECGVVGNEDPLASVPGEIVPSGDFYDYAAKYLDGTSELHVPAELDEAALEAVRRYSIQAFRCLDLAGLARVDFLVERSSGRIYFNEINTLPGFTPISMFPKLWEASGVTYPALIERLVALALERAEAEQSRRSRWQEKERKSS